ncbi:MAG: AAA family ATPase [Lentisphaeria bacterium]|nr:AAA family ATPase [Lentisphaeria bacterium]
MSEKSKYKVKISITDPKGRSSNIELGPGTYRLGRSEDSDIRFPDSAKTISRNHAELTISEDEISIKDLESSYGTMINGNIVNSHSVEDNDIISLSDYTLRIELPKSEKKEERKSSMIVQADPEEKKIENLTQELEALKKATDTVVSEVSKRIIGQENIVRLIWASIIAKGHCLLIGVPGLAKTFMVTTFADVLGLNFKRIQFTPDLMPSDIIGSNVIQENEDGRREFEFIQGPIFTQLLLADEINRTPPKTQAALLEAMQERQVTIANRTLTLPSPFCVIASQNPIEQEGTYPLPEAQQDRFMLCLILDYPDRKDEVEILVNTTQGSIAKVQQVVNYNDILNYQRIVDAITVSREIAEYAADLSRATRPGENATHAWVNEFIDWGAGPRAGQALIRTAKALAAMDGRPAISHQDVKDIALSVLRHRISCNYRARTEKLNEDKVILRLIDEVKSQ